MPLEVRANVLRKGAGFCYSARVVDPAYPSIPVWECSHDHDTRDEALTCGDDWLHATQPEHVAHVDDPMTLVGQSNAVSSGSPAEASPSTTRTRRELVWISVGLAAVFLVGALWYSDDSSLRNTIGRLSTQLGNSQEQLSTTQAQLTVARQEALNPTLETWNVPGTIGPNSWLAGSVPDTFTFHLRFMSSGDTFFAFLTLSEYVRFNECPGNVYSLNPSINRLAAGCIDYWLFNNRPPADRVGVFPAGVNVNFDFHYAEGCASWVSVLMPEKARTTLTIQPSVAVTYAPASSPTPGCT